jgi:hypothetical protein
MPTSNKRAAPSAADDALGPASKRIRDNDYEGKAAVIIS